MRVLVVQNIAGIAGSENYFLSLLPELKSQGIQCSFLNIYRNRDKEIAQKFSQMLRDKGIEVFEYVVKSYYTTSPSNEIYRLWKKHSFSLVHSHLIYADFWTSLAKRKSGGKLKMVSTLHGYHEKRYVEFCRKPEKLPRGLYFYLAKYSLKNADGIYACSRGLKSFYERGGILKKDRAEVILHGFNYPENDTSVPIKGDPALVIAGRVIKRKGHHFVINILPRLKEKFPKIHLTIVGSGDEESALKALAEVQKIDSDITFAGYKSNVREYINAADLVIVPSYAEGLPLVIFEAFSTGKPVITFDTIGCNEAVTDNKTGLIAKAFDQDDLFSKIVLALEDKQLSDSLGNAGRESLQTTFSLERMVRETAEYYRKFEGYCNI